MDEHKRSKPEHRRIVDFIFFNLNLTWILIFLCLHLVFSLADHAQHDRGPDSYDLPWRASLFGGETELVVCLEE